MAKSTSITLAFYYGKGTNPLQARIVSALTGHYTHVEIIFNGREACSVNQRIPVYFTTQKEFKRDDWEFLTILDIPVSNVDAMRNFCIDEAKNGATFDFDATNKCLTPMPLHRPNPNKWFCSYLVATVLQIGGILPKSVVASAVTPTSLFKLVQKYIPKNRLINDSNPHFAKRLDAMKCSVLDL